MFHDLWGPAAGVHSKTVHTDALEPYQYIIIYTGFGLILGVVGLTLSSPGTE